MPVAVGLWVPVMVRVAERVVVAVGLWVALSVGVSVLVRRVFVVVEVWVLVGVPVREWVAVGEPLRVAVGVQPGGWPSVLISRA